MKHFNTLLTVMFLLVWGGNIQSAKAQNSDIDWTKNAIDFRTAVNRNVYLYTRGSLTPVAHMACRRCLTRGASG